MLNSLPIRLKECSFKSNSVANVMCVVVAFQTKLIFITILVIIIWTIRNAYYQLGPSGMWSGFVPSISEFPVFTIAVSTKIGLEGKNVLITKCHFVPPIQVKWRHRLWVAQTFVVPLFARLSVVKIMRNVNNKNLGDSDAHRQFPVLSSRSKVSNHKCRRGTRIRTR